MSTAFKTHYLQIFSILNNKIANSENKFPRNAGFYKIFYDQLMKIILI